VWAITLGVAVAARAETPIELQSLKVQRQDQQLVLSASWQFELPSALEDALYKGVPLYFVTEVELTRERWYFYDKRIARAERHVRLAYLPLTQRWRVNVASQALSNANLGLSLGQSYDTLADALAVVRRFSQWTLAPASEVDLDARHNLDLRFRLDLTQLPRPLQMGVSAQSDWNLSWSRVQRLQVDPR